MDTLDDITHTPNSIMIIPLLHKNMIENRKNEKINQQPNSRKNEGGKNINNAR